LKTLVETAGTTLIASRLVDRTLVACRALRPARVLALFVDAALEEARTTCHTSEHSSPITQLLYFTNFLTLQFDLYIQYIDSCDALTP